MNEQRQQIKTRLYKERLTDINKLRIRAREIYYYALKKKSSNFFQYHKEEIRYMKLCLQLPYKYTSVLDTWKQFSNIINIMERTCRKEAILFGVDKRLLMGDSYQANA